MLTGEKISLECPYCGQEIYQPLEWFKNSYFTCPACGNGLADGQFAAAVDAIEQALDAGIENILYGKSDASSCCGKKSSGCCGD